MKIDPINNSKPPMISRIKQSVCNFSVKLKTLVSDVFQKKEEDSAEYVTIGDKKYPSYLIPNAIGRDDDYKSATWSRIEFYPEDIEKMKSMTARECIEYKNKLMDEGKCYEVPLPNLYDLEKNNKK